MNPNTSFADKLRENALSEVRSTPTTVQLNLGKRCNQACHHCHVDASPARKESMSLETAEHVLSLIRRSPSVSTVDITGGAPELNPHFRYLVELCRKEGKHVIDRCNLTILFEPNQESLADFLTEHEVEIVASLPCYSEANVDRQRGHGVFGKSIRALKWLNEKGYGDRLSLILVYNPLGPYLPPNQKELEADYRQKLWKDFGIRFTSLYAITNMPIARFHSDLVRSGQSDTYQRLLEDHFSISAANAVMCRDLISVNWDGRLSDCDFNQMLEMPLQGKRTIWEIDSFEELGGNAITFSDHCYGCTAGQGSSCTGVVTKAKGTEQ